MPKGSSGRSSRAEQIRERIEGNMLDSHLSGFSGDNRDVHINTDALRSVLNDLNTLARMRELDSDDRALRDRVKALLGSDTALEQQWEREERDYWDRVASSNSGNNQNRSSIDTDDDWELPF